MSIVEQFTSIREAVGDEIYPKIEPTLNKIASGLRETEIKLESKKTEYNALYKEMKEAKEKKTEVSKELEKAQNKITELESDDSASKITKENADLRAKNEGLQKTVDEHNKQRRERFIAGYNSYTEHSDFETIKSKLKLPESKKEGENGEIDWEKVPDEDIFANLKIIRDAEDFGLFKERKKSLATSNADEKGLKTKGKGYFKDHDFK